MLADFLRQTVNQFEAEKSGAGFEDVDGLGETARIDEKAVRRRFADTPRHGHGFGGGGGLVEQRGIGRFQAGEVTDHLLEVHQRLQPTLGDFRLIGRIGGVPARILQHIAQDHLGCVGVVVAEADQRLVDFVAAGDGFQRCQRFSFRTRFGQRGWRGQTDGWRHGFIDQRIQTEDIKRIQHGAYFIGVGADMAGDEFIAVFEGGEGQACVHLRASGGRGRRGKWEG